MLPTIAEATTPSDEVASSRFQSVAQLYKVLEDRPSLEKNPAQVFVRTYLTKALQTVVDQMVQFVLRGHIDKGEFFEVHQPDG